MALQYINTPMAYLPPEDGVQLMISRYVLIGTATLMAWDIMCHLGDDYLLIKKHRWCTPTIIYLLTRAASFLFFASYAILLTGPVGHCQTFKRTLDSFFPLVGPLAELLFLLHVRALYMSNKPVVTALGLLWVATLISSIVPVIGSDSAVHIGPTQYCIAGLVPDYFTAGAIVPLANSIILYAALCWRILKASYRERSFMNDFHTVAFALHIPRMCRALLKNGQAYFLITITFCSAALAVFYLQGNRSALLFFSSFCLMNIMACRLYRETKLGRMDADATTSPSVSIPLSALAFTSSSHPTTHNDSPHPTVADANPVNHHTH